MQFNTPLRYPGGKGRLTQYVGDLIKRNDLVGGHYSEPFAGGAGIGITLLYLDYVSQIHLNDLDVAVYSFWRSVLDHSEGLCRLIRDTPVDMDEWRRQRAVQKSPAASTLELGFSTFFLNRTNRSGIITGGVIGGKNQEGAWRLDARYNREELARRIEKIASFRSRIKVYNLDASAFIRQVLPELPERGLVYLDPPYYVKGRELYQNHFAHEDHANLATLVSSEVKQRWIVSYDNVPAIRDFYRDFEQATFGLKYSAAARYEGTEVMIYSPGLSRGEVIEPFRGIAA
jgi:DNA adenine methylase